MLNREKLLFIVLSQVAALLLPINRIIEVKSLPTHRDSATLHSGVTDYHYLLIIPFIRVSIINFNHGEGSSKQNKKTRQHYTYYYYRIIYDTSK